MFMSDELSLSSSRSPCYDVYAEIGHEPFYAMVHVCADSNVVIYQGMGLLALLNFVFSLLEASLERIRITTPVSWQRAVVTFAHFSFRRGTLGDIYFAVVFSRCIGVGSSAGSLWVFGTERNTKSQRARHERSKDCRHWRRTGQDSCGFGTHSRPGLCGFCRQLEFRA